MSPADTNRYQSLLDLTVSQVTALEVIEMGGTHEEAASAAGVHRVTVTKWCHHHPAFIAERNRRQIERAEQIAVIAEVGTIRAIEVIIASIDSGDARTALQWLRLAGSAQIIAHRAKVDRSNPITARKVVDAVAESEAMSSPMAVLSSSYLESAIASISNSLEA